MAQGVRLAAIGAAAVLIGAGVVYGLQRLSPLPMPQTVRVAAGPQAYRPAGESRLGNRVVDAPVQTTLAPTIEVMTFHVSQADYAQCVTAAACAAAPGAVVMEMGVANPSAQGQAMISTDTAVMAYASTGAGLQIIHAANAATAISKTAGTNTAAILSATP